MNFPFNLLDVLRKPISIFSAQELPKTQRALERVVDIIDEIGIASARAQGLRAPVTSALKLKQHPDQRIYIMREECHDDPSLDHSHPDNAASDLSRNANQTYSLNDATIHSQHVNTHLDHINKQQKRQVDEFRFTSGGLAGFDDMANVGRHVVVGLIKIGIKHLFLVDEYGRQIEISPICVLDFYIHEAYQRRGYGKRLFDFMLAIEFILPNQLCYDRPSEKFLSFLHKHYGLHDYIPQPNNFIVFREFGLGMLELDSKGRPKPPMVLNRTRRPAVRTPAKMHRAEGLLKAYEHITKANEVSPNKLKANQATSNAAIGNAGGGKQSTNRGDHDASNAAHGGTNNQASVSRRDRHPNQSKQSNDGHDSVAENDGEKAGDDAGQFANISTNLPDLTRSGNSRSVQTEKQQDALTDSQNNRKSVNNSQASAVRSPVERLGKNGELETYHEHLYVPPDLSQAEAAKDNLNTSGNDKSKSTRRSQDGGIMGLWHVKQQEANKQQSNSNANGVTELSARAERLLANAAAAAQQKQMLAASKVADAGNANISKQTDAKKLNEAAGSISYNDDRYDNTYAHDPFKPQNRMRVHHRGGMRTNDMQAMASNQQQQQSSSRARTPAHDAEDDYFATPKRGSSPNRASHRPDDAVPIDPVDGPINWEAHGHSGNTVPYTYGRNMTNPELAAIEAERKARVRMLIQSDRFPHVPASGSSLVAPSGRENDMHSESNVYPGTNTTLSSVALISGGLGPLIDRNHSHQHRAKGESYQSAMNAAYEMRRQHFEHGARVGLAPLSLPMANSYQRHRR